MHVFPIEYKENKEKPKILVSKSYRSWKDAKTDLNVHSVTKGHVVAKRDAFLQTYSKPVSQIDNILSKGKKEVVEKKQNISYLHSKMQ